MNPQVTRIMARKRSKYSFLQYMSNMGIFVEAYQKFQNHIKPIHLELMERTPFWDLFKTYREGIATNDAWKNDYDVIDILETYNKDLKCFDIGGKRLTITAIDIAAIFGLKWNYLEKKFSKVVTVETNIQNTVDKPLQANPTRKWFLKLYFGISDLDSKQKN
ncbi:hypothetical protein DVH24_024300 [Malus domestica]|uniref:Aminotransferase-like plant mobile domain-containing protein n=1 Tax=Malus domestica TaxID=3750 RepID=A0A498JHQ1_MALDO|nr:hypothetical protein DVH24_024300 [Malus domestica]